MPEKFSYETTLKTGSGNEFLNLQKFLFITSKTLTRFFYYTGVSPHFVILLSLIFGITASFLIIPDSLPLNIAGAALLFYKNVLDKVDGSLARAKKTDSRRGRFYDSISDFIVTLTVFTAITYKLYIINYNIIFFFLGFTSMIFSMLHCSYFIFYQVSFIKSTGKKTVNRLIETVTAEDLKAQDKWTLILQRIFLVIYGWQDKIMFALDSFLLKKLSRSVMKYGQENQNSVPGEVTHAWYQNKPFLALASSLSIGTHIFLISISMVFNLFGYYFFVNLILMNLLLILSVVYHYISAKNNLINA